MLVRTLVPSLLLVVLLVSQGANKITGVEPFHVEIPIRKERNLMFAEVEISNRKYNFLIDTGAPMVISTEVAKEIGFKATKSKHTRSSNGLSGTSLWGTLKQVRIASLTFSNIPTAVVNFESTKVIKCLGVDGIIGANLMSAGIWQFQYDNNKVVVTNSLQTLDNVVGVSVMRFKKVGANKSPYISASINRQRSSLVLFDTGFNGFFDLPYSSYRKSLGSENLNSYIEVVTGRGWGAEGVFGSIDTTLFQVKVNQLQVGEETFVEPVFAMGHTKSPKVGVMFLKGRTVTLDYPAAKMYVQKNASSYYPQKFETFGLGIAPGDNGVIIGNLFEDSPASRAGLKVKDVLVAIDGFQLPKLEKCQALQKAYDLLQTAKSLEVTILRDAKTKVVSLTKETLLGRD